MAHRFEESSIQDLIQKSQLISSGKPSLYNLITTQSNLDTNGKVRKWTFGQRDITKPNKILLLVGETGTGKTTLINCFVNDILGTTFKDGAWFEITGERTVNQTETSDETTSKTNSVTVYEVFAQHSKTSLTIIDTPGYGHVKGAEYDKEIAENLYNLFQNDTGVKEVDVVCFVVKASENRLSERKQYIFDAILSLFGKDIGDNIVILATHSDGGPPTNVIKAIQKAKIPCKKDSKNNPEVYTFNNRQAEARDENEGFYRDIWEKTANSLKIFFQAMDSLKRKSLKQTEDVLIECVQLKATLNNLHDRIEDTNLQSKRLNEIKEALKCNREKIKNNENFTFTVTKSSKQKVPIESSSWVDRKATCCSVCEENCHEYSCWCAPKASWCMVMKNEHCVVCKKKCHHSKHIKENKKYVTKTEKSSMTYEDLKKQYEDSRGNINVDSNIFNKIKTDHEKNIKDTQKNNCLENQIKDDLIKAKEQKAKLVEEAGTSILRLSDISLKPESAFIIECLDYLIPQAEETEKSELGDKLQELRNIEPETLESIQAAMKFRKLKKLTNFSKPGKN